MPRSKHTTNLLAGSLKKRHRAEQRFRFYGWGALCCVVAILTIMLVGIIKEGASAFTKASVLIDIPKDLTQATYSNSDIDALFEAIVVNATFSTLDAKDRHAILHLLSPLAPMQFKAFFKRTLGTRDLHQHLWIPFSDQANEEIKKKSLNKPINSSPFFNDVQKRWLHKMQAEQRLQERFNWNFLNQADSREPEQAGIWGAVVGSFYTVLITLLLAFPLGVGAALYLEEFSSDTWLARLIDLNIRNLTAVPSVIFGLLGVVIFLNFLQLPRSSALVGGMTLALIALPIIILAARTALRAVPISIRQAAQGLGASPVQVTFHHVLPLAMSGIMTGTILALARTLSESAPLLMLGMVAFVADAPKTPLDPATVIPVQIYTWARNPEPGFAGNAAAAIIVLLGFLIILNISAVIIRKRFEHRW